MGGWKGTCARVPMYGEASRTHFIPPSEVLQIPTNIYLILLLVGAVYAVDCVLIALSVESAVGFPYSAFTGELMNYDMEEVRDRKGRCLYPKHVRPNSLTGGTINSLLSTVDLSRDRRMQ